MKHFIWYAIGALAAIAMALAIYTTAYNRGVQHAICDSTIYTVECYDPNDPYANATDEYDQTIYIELDGDTYAHGMIQG